MQQDFELIVTQTQTALSQLRRPSQPTSNHHDPSCRHSPWYPRLVASVPAAVMKTHFDHGVRSRSARESWLVWEATMIHRPVTRQHQAPWVLWHSGTRMWVEVFSPFISSQMTLESQSSYELDESQSSIRRWIFMAALIYDWLILSLLILLFFL